MSFKDAWGSTFESPYDAFTNYMNILADFLLRVDAEYPTSIENEELNALLLTIRNQEQEIEVLNREIEMMRNNIVKDTTGDFVPKVEEEEPQPLAPKKAVPKKAAPKKAAAKKAPAKKPAAKKTTKK